MPDRALILGATGGIGGETLQALRRHGWSLAALVRRLPSEGPPDVEWFAGDAMNAGDVARAAAGASVIVHAVNPPGYRDWEKLVLPMIDNSIAAARANNARVVLPGTIYNYGADAFPVLTEDSPQHPPTRKGEIRVALEQRLQNYGRALIARFGDFFGPKPGNSRFSQAFVKPGRKLNSITNPGDPGVGHAWAYLPDAGETIARLLDRPDLPDFARFHFAGHWDPDGTAMPRAIAAAVGRPDLPVKRLPWFALRAAGLGMPTPRELSKMHYLWRTPVRLDNSRLVQFLGAEAHTPLDGALARTLRGLNVT